MNRVAVLSLPVKSNRHLKGLWVAEIDGRVRLGATVAADKLWVFEKLIDIRTGAFIF